MSAICLALGLFLSPMSVLSADKQVPYTLPPALKGNDYSVQISFPVQAFPQAVYPFTFVISKGSPPEGISINPNLGLLSGKPKDGISVEKDYEFTVTVTDRKEQSTSFDFKMHLFLAAQTQLVLIGGPDQASVGGSSPASQTQSNCVKNQTVPATYALQEGTTQISGIAAQPGSGCAAQLNVYSVKQSTVVDPKDPLKSKVEVQRQLLALTSSNTPTGGKFELQLQSPLEAGQTIQVEEVITDTSTNTPYPLLSAASEVSSVGDWGRVKAYFTSGILLSQDQTSFSQSSLFLSFILDKNWQLPGYRRHSEKTTVPHLGWPPGINSFFETRLTSIPVTAQACQPSTGTGTPATTCPSGNQLSTFLTSRKTARLQVGVYMPFTATEWNYKGKKNTLFIAPIAKVGFDTPTAPTNPQQLQAQSSGSSGGSTSQVGLVNNTNFYTFYSYGARLGHYAMTNTKDEAPELISYLDVSAGRYSNLESILADGSRKRLYRLNVEGVLKVPSTPLIVGVSANVGQSSAGVGNSEIKQKAGDDLRFLFGTKFDIGKLLGELKKSAF